MHTPLYHPVTIGSLTLAGNLFLAPVAGFTDRSFRSICASAGASLTFTELASAEAITRGGKATLALIQRGENETPYAVQLFGHDPDVMYRAAKALAPFHPDAVDINAGCPVPKVVKTGAGSALMKNPSLLAQIVRAVVRASEETLSSVPVTVKMRSGWDGGSQNYLECARAASCAGAAMVTLHPRTRAQGYTGKAAWEHIANLAQLLTIPVAGSGDLYTPEDAATMLEQTGCAALMFARGASGNPFIFPASRALLQGNAWNPPTFAERMAAAYRHLLLMARDTGEAAACREMRKQFAAYTKPPPGTPGEAGSAALRDRLVHATIIEDYRTILAPYID